MATERFQAFRIHRDAERVSGRVETLSLDDLGAGNVVIRTGYSSVNYKDALAATGASPIVRRFPLVGGIDAAGTVIESADPRFSVGDQVIVGGHDFGVAHDGGFAGRVRAPGDWVLPIPEGLSPFEAMALGTAGFTAALALLRLERHGLTPGDGPVIVTGATGGVGSLAISCLVARGYSVTALTGKADEAADYLRELGATEIINRRHVTMGTRPLERATWAAAIDAVGGETLAWLTRTMRHGGAIAATGLAGGTELHTTVMPFILRGVSLLGIDTVECGLDERLEAWARLAGPWKPPRLAAIAHEICLGDLPDAFETVLAGRTRGRMVVTI